MFFDQYDHGFYSLEEFKENIYFENNPYSEDEEPTTIYYNADVTKPYAQQAETTLLSVEIANLTNKTYKTHAEWEYEYQKLRDNIFSLVDDARSPETIKNEFNTKLLQRLKNSFEEEKESLENSIARREKLLSNENYVAKAPEAIVNQERESLAQEEAKLKVVLDRLEQIK
jgi:valyl-tRNA synthetase